MWIQYSDDDDDCRQLSTAIATVGERPLIRYSRAHRAARAMAQALDEEISHLPVCLYIPKLAFI